MSSPKSFKIESDLREILSNAKMKRSRSTIELTNELMSPANASTSEKKNRWDSSDSENEDNDSSKKVIKTSSNKDDEEVSLNITTISEPNPPLPLEMNETSEQQITKSPVYILKKNRISTPELVNNNEDELNPNHADHSDHTPNHTLSNDDGLGFDDNVLSKPMNSRLFSSASLPNFASAETELQDDGTSTSMTSTSVVVDDHNPLFKGCRNVDYFEKVRMVDEGTYGVVFAAKNRKTGELVALKKVKLSKDSSNRDGFPITALRETNVLLALQHPNIVSVREMVVGKRMDEVFMVMEYFENDLKHVLSLQRDRNRKAREEMLGSIGNKRDFDREPVFKIRQVKCFMLQLLSGMEFMHRCWYLHRDLKTANILYNSSGKLAICDFGLARKFGEPIKPYTTNIVTLYYRPPEILMGTKTYSTEVDMWSIGCIFAEILTGHYFFEGISETDQLSKIFNIMGQPNNKDNLKWKDYDKLPYANMFKWKGLPRESKLRDKFPRATAASAFTDINESMTLSDLGFELLEGLLTLDPTLRLSASDALKHAWFQEEPLPLPRHLMPVYPPASEFSSSS